MNPECPEAMRRPLWRKLGLWRKVLAMRLLPLMSRNVVCRPPFLAPVFPAVPGAAGAL
jgi:hypothetical protein